MIDDALLDATDRMEKALEALRRDLATVRTGRASPALVEHLKVDYYGAATPLNQLATISTPDARLITIQPWDRGSIGAIEIDADILLMAKKNVNGVYEADPVKDPSARKFLRLSYLDALNRRLQVMDSTALSLCMENSLPIVVFNLRMPRSIELAASRKDNGTIVGDFETVLEDASASAKR